MEPLDDRSPAQPGARTSWQLVGDRTLGPYLGASVVSGIGNWFQNVAAVVVVFELTGSSLLVGAVSAVQFMTTLLLGPWAGQLADRHDRRRIVLLAEAIAASGALALAVWVVAVGVDGLPGVWPVFAATAIIGLRDGIGSPALNALVPSLAPPADLDRAIALHSATFTVARAIGPALAGLVLTLGSPELAFSLNVITFVPLLVVLSTIRPRTTPERSGDTSLLGGLRYARANPAVPLLLLSTLALGWMGDPVSTLAPAMADLFGRGDDFIGLQVAAFGSGAAVAIAAVGPSRDRLGRNRAPLAGAGVLALGTAGYAAAPNGVAALVALFVAGSGSLVASATINANLQSRLTEGVRGRVMALWLMAFLGSKPLAGLIDGAVADLIGPRVGIAVAVVPVLAVWWGLRRVERLDAVNPPPARAHPTDGPPL